MEIISLPIVTDNTAWSGLTTGARCWFNNDSITYENPYGNLYNWYAVADIRNICPTGWHVPTDAEWTILTTYLGSQSVAGGKMKSIGIGYWRSPNTDATNESGFSALPGGYRQGGGPFDLIKNTAIFWSTTEENYSNAWYPWYRELIYNDGYVYRSNVNKYAGLSVRCLRD